MRIGLIALKIRAANTSFGNNVGGAVELSHAQRGTLKKETMFVIPLEEDAPPNKGDTHVIQDISERFGVVVALPTDTEQSRKLGLKAYDRLHDIREELFNALININLQEGKTEIYFRTGRLLDITRANLWYQYEFEYRSELRSGITDLANGTKVDPGDGFAGITVTRWSDRQQVSQLADFDTIRTQWTLGPSVKLDDALDELAQRHGQPPISTDLVDMTTIVDLTDDPNAGAYNKGFGYGYDRIKP
jgi:hypothetical protein